jgi:hypothetical protein
LWIRGFTIVSLLVAIVACQPGLADVGSTPPEESLTTGAATTADSAALTANSTPISGLRPEVRSYRQRYLSDIAPLIVHCMNDLGWEANYDPRLGAILPEVPLSQALERDGAMSFCVAGSRTSRGIYAD